MSYTQQWNDEFKKNTAFLERRQMMSIMEIGSFEGLTSNFICDELLAWNGRLICIDPLQSDYALDGDGSLFDGQFERFTENIQSHKDNITLIREKSTIVLPFIRSESQDFIYVDGDHTYPSVYFDGTEAFRICKVGGYILFDDYEWGNTKEVKRAIDQVLSENTNYELLLRLNQVLVKKTEIGNTTADNQDWYQEESIKKLFNGDTIYAAYCNLNARTDRNEGMISELSRIDLSIPFHRQPSFYWEDLYNNFSEEERERVGVMYQRTKGAIGCHFSQVEVMKQALAMERHAWVNEDDLKFADDMHRRLKIIFKFLNQHEWDIFWMGGTYHIQPTWHKSIEGVHTHPEMKGHCNCLLNRDWEETLNPNIVRTYGAFSTHSYIVNKNRIQHILDLLDRNLHLSMGIDWIMLKEQPNLNTFAFNPGCVKQIDSMSDISNAFARQSGFKNLGKHWWAASMDNK